MRRCSTSDQEKVERNWLRRGFSCGLWNDPAGRRREDFVHNTDEVVMVVNHREARVAFRVRLEAFAPGIRHFSPKPSFVNPAQTSADFVTVQ